MAKHCIHRRGQVFDSVFMKHCQDFNVHESRPNFKLGHVAQKTKCTN